MQPHKDLLDMNFTEPDLLLSPQTHYIFLGMDVTLIVPMIYFHFLMQSMLKRENKKKCQNLIKNLLGGYVGVIPFSFLVIAAYINALTTYLDSPSSLIGPWFCIIFEIFGHIDIIYIGSFSLWAAFSKYWFIVHNKKATKFGEAKARKIIFAAHIVVPVVLSFLNSISNGKTDQIFWVDHCWGDTKPNKSIGDSKAKTVMQNLFCVDRNYDLPSFFGESAANVVTKLLRTTCGSLKFAYMIFLSNMMEFFLYFLIFRYLNR